MHGSISLTPHTIALMISPHERLLEVFILCRTTFDDLSVRVDARGHQLSGATIAGYMTGQRSLSADRHNAVADAINSRLLELEMNALAPYRPTGVDASPASPHRLPPASVGDPQWVSGAAAPGLQR